MAFHKFLVSVIAGYLSIDCGSDVNYTDSTTGIHWVTDANYISTGKNYAQNGSVGSNDPLVNKRQAETLRYFPEGRSRDCYVLPMTPGRTYLIRATFYYGDWANAYGDSYFYLYLNNTNWNTQSGGPGICFYATFISVALPFVL